MNQQIDSLTDTLIQSMCGPLFNKVKTSFLYARKNKDLAKNADIRNLIFLLGEQLLPQWCKKNATDAAAINEMHNLVYLLAQKAHQVFFTRVIHTIIDQNWDLKGLKQVLARLLKIIDLRPSVVRQTVEKQLEKINTGQNLQSTSCIRILSSYMRNVKKPIQEDDLRNPIKTYQTDFEFIKEDIERYREQNMSHECFQVLHPWAYELEAVDLKYVLNNNLNNEIHSLLKDSPDALVFWLTFFKPQLSCTADEFLEAIRQLCEINKARDFWVMNAAEYEMLMHETQFIISLEQHASTVIKMIKQFVGYTMEKCGSCVLRDQLKLYIGDFQGTSFADAKSLLNQFSYMNDPVGPLFQVDRENGEANLPEGLTQINLVAQKESQLEEIAVLNVVDMAVKVARLPEHCLSLKFVNADTEELRNIELKFKGDRSIFKVGEAESNHFQIPNDKKLLESQFMVICSNGQYYIRDLGFVHTSRVKLDLQTEVQLHQDCVVDIGKIVHYHFDKLLHDEKPIQQASKNFIIMRQEGNRNYEIDKDDHPYLRARPQWISPEESEDAVQNEINIFADGPKSVQTIGRSSKRDVQLKLKAVSAEHCQVAYNQDKGWTLAELGKSKTSSNGTFVFLKTLEQSKFRKPSDMIPLYDGMTISFVNYELKVSLQPYTATEYKTLQQDTDVWFQSRPQGCLGYKFDPVEGAATPMSSMPPMGSVRDSQNTLKTQAKEEAAQLREESPQVKEEVKESEKTLPFVEVLYEGEFSVKTDIETTMRFLCYAEMYPINVEPGWEDGKASLGEVRNGGKEFDATMINDKGETYVCGIVSNRMVQGNTLMYDFKNTPGGNPLFTIVSVFELSPSTDAGFKTKIKRTMKNFQQLRNPELPLPKKVPGTIGKQHERIQMLTEQIADGKMSIPSVPSRAPLGDFAAQPSATMSDREYMMVKKDGYQVEYLASQMFCLPESPIWSDDHQAFYWEDQYVKYGGLWRLKWGSKTVEKLNLPFAKGALKMPKTTLGPGNALGCFHPTKTPDVFVAAVRRGGLYKMTIKPDSTNVRLEPLGINPLKHDKFGGGPHPKAEFFNDGKVSPDGHFFVGNCDFQNWMTKDEEIRKHYWTMNGKNRMGPLLYRFDIDKKTAVVQEEVGHHLCGNGPNWSPDGSKFYYVCSSFGEIREYNYDMATSTVKGPARTVCKFDNKWGGPGAMFDGGAVDTKGFLWFALNGAGKIIRVDPASGNVERMIELDAICPSSCSFGGPDMKTLFVTCMGENPRPGTAKIPNGSVCVITFDDKSIQGMPINKLNHDLYIAPAQAQKLDLNINASKIDVKVGNKADLLKKQTLTEQQVKDQQEKAQVRKGPKADPLPSVPERSGDDKKTYIKEAGQKNSLAFMMGGYKGFKEDFENAKLDEMWVEFDVDSNGLLDQAEAVKFIAKLKDVISPDRLAYYEDAKFEAIFKKFDEDKNGYLEKAEMAVLIKKVFAAPKWLPSNKIEFRYFALFGRGSPGRAMLSHAKVDFTDIGVDLADWGKQKAGAPYNGKSLPILVYPDGRILRQSKAIYRHIAKEYGFYPGDPELAFPNDWIVDTYYDHYNDNGLTNFNATEEWIKTTFETKVPSLMNKLKPYLENEHKFLLGDEPYLCDFVVGTFYTDLVTNPQAYGREGYAKVLEEYPKFKEFGEAYKAALGDYVDSREARPF